MNLDLLWEHEKRRVADGGGASMSSVTDADVGDIELTKKTKPTLLKFKKLGPAGAQTSFLDSNQCIPHLCTDDTIFERSGYALDYEGHMNKRLNQPPPSYHTTTSPSAGGVPTSINPHTSSHATHQSSTDESNKKRAIDASKRKPSTPLKAVSVVVATATTTAPTGASSPLPARHDKLSLNSLLKTAHTTAQQPTHQRTEVDPTSNAPPKVSAERTIQRYVGDYFSTRGEYVDGMLYMSRMKKSHVILYGSTPLSSSHVGASLSAAGAPVQALDGVKLKETLASAALATDKTDGNNDNDVPALSSPVSTTVGGASVKSTQAQRCASTLANWSSNPANARVMVQEGVVQAVMVLSRNDDVATRIHCVTTFMNLSNVSELRQGIIQLGAVKTLVAVLSGCDDRTLQTACALTLCNLCCLAGEEVTLVADSAVGALMALMNDAPGVAAISERALFNLTCVAEPYAQIDVVVKALVSLASSSSMMMASGGGGSTSGAMSGLGNAVVRERTLHMCAMAFVNLSNMKRVRSRLMEEGIVPAISALLRSHSLDVKHWAAYVLCNIASMRSCRVELVTKGALNILVALAPHPTLPPKTLHVIGTILCHLSKEPSIRHRLVVEGLLSVVAAIGRAQGVGSTLVLIASDDIRRVCATAIHNCSCSDDTRVKLVERDGVAVLTALSAGCGSPDVRRMCTLALCNFLMVKQAAMEVVGCGAVTSLLDLAMQPDTPLNSQLLYATAFYNLCHNPISRDSIGTTGGVAALAALCTANLPPPSPPSSLAVGVLTLCAASLCYLAADDSTRLYVATADVVHVVTRMLQTSASQAAACVPIQRFGVACLSMLSQDQLCATWILDECGIDAILAACANSRDVETKACCCDLLASLSYHTHCRQKLVSIGVLPSLTKLAKLRDPDIQRRCATAIGNLASEASVHDALLAANIVHVLSILSNSYSEESQSDCAKALCSLSTTPGFETKLVAEGAVGVLLMICAVRSGSLATKETCARALGNLLTSSTMDAMLHEGLAKLLPSLAKGGDGPASPVPATIFAKLLRHPHARLAICSESQALRTLFAYMSRDGHDAATIDLLSSIVCDLLVHANTRHKAVEYGLVAAVVDLARRTQWSNARLVAALLLLAASDDTRMDAVQDDSVHMLLAYLEPSSGHDVASPVTWTVVTALCHLGWHDVTRSHLHDPRVVVALVTLVLPRLLTLLQDPSAASTTPASTVLDATLLTLASLSFRPDHANTMLQHGICLALVGVATLPALPPLHRRLVCLLLRQVSHADSFHALLHVRDSRQPVLALVCTLCLHPSSGFLDDVAALDCADALCSIAAADGLAPKLVVEDFVGSIDALLHLSPSPDIQWRCTAALYMLSNDPSCRKAMVDLHCTNTLVRVARSSAANHPTLQMCTLTLMHLSVDAGNAAAQMVAEDAVSALLHLSTFDSDVTRDACSLALANLSHESPPVPSGSVLALIHLSMHGKSTTSSSPTSGGGVAHPPHITTPHHESNAAPPVYTYDEVDYATMMAAKYVADVADRQPPIPHLPTITVDPESLHASMDNPGGGSSNVTSSSAHDHDELLTAQQLVFQKIEPTDPTHLGGGGLDGGGAGLLDDLQEEHEANCDDMASPASPEPKHGDGNSDGVGSHGRAGSCSSSTTSSHDKSSRQLLNHRRTTKGLLKKRSNIAMLVVNAPGSFRAKKSSDSEIYRLKKRPSKVVGLGATSIPCSSTSSTSSLSSSSSTSHGGLAPSSRVHTAAKKGVQPLPPDVQDVVQNADDLRQQARKMGLWS